MNDISQLIDNFSGRYQQKILKTTEPLLNQFGITYFCYQHVSNNGEWTIFGNNPDWLTYSAENKFYLMDPSLVNPEHSHSGVVLADTHVHPEFQNIMNKQAHDSFDLAHCLVIIEKTHNGCDYYFLSAPSKHTGVYNFYLNHLPSLQKKFLLYFKHLFYKQIDAMNDYAIDLKPLKNDAYFRYDNVLSILDSTKNHCEILTTKLSTYHKPRLTTREKHCLNYYKMGKTAKETAKILNISHRTVEEYFESMKDKFGCSYKRELITIDFCS